MDQLTREGRLSRSRNIIYDGGKRGHRTLPDGFGTLSQKTPRDLLAGGEGLELQDSLLLGPIDTCTESQHNNDFTREWRWAAGYLRVFIMVSIFEAARIFLLIVSLCAASKGSLLMGSAGFSSLSASLKV
jgi:hypothetical protein